MTSLSKPRIKMFSEVVEALNRLGFESEDEAVNEIASLIERVDEKHVESLLRILRMDFEEASRLIGTQLLIRIVSEALASITPLKQNDVEELLENGKVGEILRRRSRILIDEGLSISQVYVGMLEVCRVSGKGSIGSKARKLANLLSKSSEEEAVFIVSMLIHGERKISDELLIKALEKAFNTRLDSAMGSEGFYERIKQLIKECRTR
ncbi:MAG: hypothetical protein FGF52_01230 [Candidatus Brockarchaeota archaeon]|nr:hypothetical protein [Candidatus Brockarchaeota archaeon]